MADKTRIKIEKAANIDTPPVRRVQEMARMLARVNEMSVAMADDEDQPKRDLEKAVGMLSGALKVSVLAGLSKGLSIETRYDFSPETERDWSEEVPIEDEVTPEQIRQIKPSEENQPAVQQEPVADEPDRQEAPAYEENQPADLDRIQELERELDEAIIPTPVPKRGGQAE